MPNEQEVALTGLNDSEVLTNREKFGVNILPAERTLTWIDILISQFKSPLIALQLIVGFVSLLIGEVTDFILIEAVLVLNVLMGFVQEFTANKNFVALKALMAPKAIVIRNSQRLTIPASELVVKDLIVLGSGDKIPADSTIIESQKLLVREAILTGESEAIAKEAKQDNKLFLGTDILSGKAIAQVTAVGKDTELGKIGKSIATMKAVKTPLQKALEIFSFRLGLIVFVICVLLLVIGIAMGQDVGYMIQLAVVLAIAGIPEGLPIAVTVILSLGAKRILKRHGLVKNLLSVETLGSTTVLCLDKTGTLTEGIMTIVHSSLKNPNRAIDAMLLTNEQRTNIEVALWNYLTLTYRKEFFERKSNFKKLHDEPFSSERKYSLAVGKFQDGTRTYITGAPDIVSLFCEMSELEQKSFESELKELTAQGLRLIAYATKEGSHTELREGFTFEGFIGIADPLRKEVKTLLETSKRAGLSIKIITGDHKLTAEKLIRDVGIDLKSSEIIEGKDIDQLSDEELRQRITTLILFARVTPQHKLRIVEALQSRKEVVAMTGDGVNDAQALKKADIGIVMGTSSDVAKDAGDLILLKNDFHVILHAIEEGRLLFKNVKKTIAYVLSNSFAEIILLFGAMVVGLPAPLTIAQLLWQHIICDGPLDIVLGFEPKEENLMNKRTANEVRNNKQVLDTEMYLLVGGISSLIGIVGLLVFAYFKETTGDVAFAQTITFATIGAVDAIYLFAFKSLDKSILSIKHLLNNMWLNLGSIYGVGLLLIALYFPPIANLLGTQRLPLQYLILPLGLALMTLLWVEFVKIMKKKLTISS